MYNSSYGLSAPSIIIVLVIYLGSLALAMWVGYLIMRTAVKNGTLLAHEQMNVHAAATASANAHDTRTASERRAAREASNQAEYDRRIAKEAAERARTRGD